MSNGLQDSPGMAPIMNAPVGMTIISGQCSQSLKFSSGARAEDAVSVALAGASANAILAPITKPTLASSSFNGSCFTHPATGQFPLHARSSGTSSDNLWLCCISSKSTEKNDSMLRAVILSRPTGWHRQAPADPQRVSHHKTVVSGHLPCPRLRQGVSKSRTLG